MEEVDNIITHDNYFKNVPIIHNVVITKNTVGLQLPTIEIGFK